MPKKDFTQIAYAVVQAATGEAPKAEPRKPKKQTAPKAVTKGAAKKSANPKQ